MSDIIVEHGTTSDGLMAARVDGLAYIAIPLKEGFSIVSGWKLNRPICKWSRSDVYCAEGAVADEVSFRAYIADIALHVRRSEEHTSELQSLMRSSYAVFCLKNKTIIQSSTINT